MKKLKRFLRVAALGLLVILFLGFLPKEEIQMPVSGATSADFNQNSFWAHPWGKSGTHKGVDIFAKTGTEIRSSTEGIVLSAGQNSMGGKIVLILGPKWRVHYYAHLDRVDVKRGQRVNHESVIGTVGTSGNAQGKPPHLHYTIATAIPYFWRIDDSPQGWKKMFYLNPIPMIK